MHELMRLSATQKDVLCVLCDLAVRKNITGPVPAMQLLAMINLVRVKPIADTNFRTSCHTLVKHGLLQKFRNPDSLQLAFSLSQNGLNKARPIYAELLNRTVSNAG